MLNLSNFIFSNHTRSLKFDLSSLGTDYASIKVTMFRSWTSVGYIAKPKNESSSKSISDDLISL